MLLNLRATIEKFRSKAEIASKVGNGGRNFGWVIWVTGHSTLTHYYSINSYTQCDVNTLRLLEPVETDRFLILIRVRFLRARMGTAFPILFLWWARSAHTST